MARITVEDCLKQVPNRFCLAVLASKRTKQLLTGAKQTLSGIDNKPAVLALREIAAGTVRVASEEELSQLEEKNKAEEVAFADSEILESKSAVAKADDLFEDNASDNGDSEDSENNSEEENKSED